MTRKELNEVRELRDAIRSIERRLKALREAVSNLTPILDGMPHAQSQTSKVESLSVLILETERELHDFKNRMVSTVGKISQAICRALLPAQEEEVLLLRYVACMNFRDIQFKLNLSDARVFYLHRHALKNFSPSKVVVQ